MAHSKMGEICIFALALLCSLMLSAYKSSYKLSHKYPWMKEYKSGTYSDLPAHYPNSKKRKKTGLRRTQFVERQGRLGHQGMFTSPRPPVPGRGFLLEVTIYGEVDRATVLLLDEKGKEISKLKMLPRNEYSYNDYYFPGVFPSQPFFIAAVIKFKNKASTDRAIDPKRIVPRTDIDSFLFTFKPDVNSKEFKKALPEKSQSKKIELFSEGSCEYGQMLGYALYQGAQGYIEPSETLDADSKTSALPIPFFYIRHSLGMGVEPDSQCYLEVLQKKGQVKEMEFITQDNHWTMKECGRYQDLLRKFGARTRTGKRYAFQKASCISTGERVNLKLQIGFSQESHYQFSAPPTVARKLKSPVVKTSGNRVHLKQVCEVKEGSLSHFETPIDLSFERSGRALIYFGKNRESAILRAPDCKILSRYKKADFLNHIVSLDGSGVFTKNRTYGSRYATSKKPEIFGVEKSDGTVVMLTPPKNFDERHADFPEISIDGSAVIWRRTIKRHGSSYLIQNLEGQTLHELEFPLGELQKAPKIFILDMKQKHFLTYRRGQGPAIYNLQGKLIEGPTEIPKASLTSVRQTIKFFKGKKRNWVSWHHSDMGLSNEGAFIAWNTDLGKGRHNFEPGHSISSVAVNGNGRYIAVAYQTRRDTMSGKQDYMFTLLSTRNGHRVYTKKLGTERSSGMIVHQVAFLKNNYVAYNKIPGRYTPGNVVLSKIEDQE